MNEPYCYPNSHVLVNKFDIRDFDDLHVMEREITQERMATVHQIGGKFDAKHKKRPWNRC